MPLTTFDKAIAGGFVTLFVGWLARYGVTLSPLVHDALASISLGIVSYAVGHAVVWLAKNKVAV